MHIKILPSALLVTSFLILNIFMYLRNFKQLFSKVIYYVLVDIIKNFYTKSSFIEQKYLQLHIKKSRHALSMKYNKINNFVIKRRNLLNILKQNLQYCGGHDAGRCLAHHFAFYVRKVTKF